MSERKLPYFPEKCVYTMFLDLHPFNDGRRRKRLHNKILSDANDIVISYEGKIIFSISMTIGNALLTIMLNNNIFIPSYCSNMTFSIFKKCNRLIYGSWLMRKREFKSYFCELLCVLVWTICFTVCSWVSMTGCIITIFISEIDLCVYRFSMFLLYTQQVCNKIR